MRTTRLVAFAAALAITAPELSALAQPPTKAMQAEAFSRFNKGKELFSEGDYQAALIEFRRAYELAPNGAVLYNIGNVYYQLQNYPEALTHLERYLAEAKSIPAARRAEVERDVEKLRSRVSNLDITVNVPDAEISVDDQPAGKSPLSKPVMVGPGRHRISVSKSGYNSASRVVEVASAETPKIPFELTEQPPPGAEPSSQPKGDGTTTSGNTATPPPPPPPDATPPALPPKRVGVLPAWLATGALAAGAGTCGAIALLASNDLKRLRTNLGVSHDELKDDANKAKTFALVSDILSGATVVAAGVSLYLTFRTPSDSKPTSAGQASGRAGAPALALGLGPGRISLAGAF
jgi:tetratricopeptide (TPR) repeat protein